MTFRLVGVPLVLLPGLDGSGRLFERFGEALPRGTRVRVVSYPDRRPGSSTITSSTSSARCFPESGP